MKMKVVAVAVIVVAVVRMLVMVKAGKYRFEIVFHLPKPSAKYTSRIFN